MCPWTPQCEQIGFSRLCLAGAETALATGAISEREGIPWVIVRYLSSCTTNAKTFDKEGEVENLYIHPKES